MRAAAAFIAIVVAGSASAQQISISWTTVAEVENFLDDVFMPLGNTITGPVLSTGEPIGMFHVRARAGIDLMAVDYYNPDTETEGEVPAGSLIGELQVGLLPGWSVVRFGSLDGFVRLGIFPVEELNSPKYLTYGGRLGLIKQGPTWPSVSVTAGVGALIPLEIRRTTYEVFKYSQRVAFTRATVSYSLGPFRPYVGIGSDYTQVKASYDLNGPPLPGDTVLTPILNVYYENGDTRPRYFGGLALGGRFFTITAEVAYADDRVAGGLSIGTGF